MPGHSQISHEAKTLERRKETANMPHLLETGVQTERSHESSRSQDVTLRVLLLQNVEHH